MTNFFYKYSLLGLILLFAPQVGHSQSEIDSLIRQLKEPDTSLMRKAHDKLIAKDKAAIAPLIALLRNEDRIIFENEWWRSYSGKNARCANYGGWCASIDYELDIIAERAAWTLEELTLQNWGYQDVYIGKYPNDMRVIHATWRRDSLFSSPQAIKQRRAKRKILADSIAAWWKRNEHSWTKQKAIKEALYSQDTIRQCTSFYLLIYHNHYNYKEKNSTDFLRLARQFAVSNSPTSQYYPKAPF